MDKIKKKIRTAVIDSPPDDSNRLVSALDMYKDWSKLLDELLVPSGHKDHVNIRRGLRNCFWLTEPDAPNVVRVREDESLRHAKSKYKG